MTKFWTLHSKGSGMWTFQIVPLKEKSVACPHRQWLAAVNTRQWTTLSYAAKCTLLESAKQKDRRIPGLWWRHRAEPSHQLNLNVSVKWSSASNEFYYGSLLQMAILHPKNTMSVFAKIYLPPTFTGMLSEQVYLTKYTTWVLALDYAKERDSKDSLGY